MRIKGVGNVKISEILEGYTKEGKAAIKAGEISWEEVAFEYKADLVAEGSKIGGYPDTFWINYRRIPMELKDKLTPSELAELVDALYDSYKDGEEDGWNKAEKLREINEKREEERKERSNK